MKLNYNEELEKEINEIIYPKTEIEIVHKSIIEKLDDRYQETNYPGYLYKLGSLYESTILKPDYPGEHLDYFRLAAEQNYLPALKKLIRLCLMDIEAKLFTNNFWIMNDNRNLTLEHDNEGKYLLSKYMMVQSIMNNHEELDYFNYLKIMKESADQGNEKAMEFMKNWNYTLEE